MHEKIPWERIMRKMATPKLFHIKDYQTRFYPTYPHPNMQVSEYEQLNEGGVKSEPTPCSLHLPPDKVRGVWQCTDTLRPSSS